MMTKTVSIALAQLNFTLGGIEENARKIIAAAETAVAQGAQLLITSELSLCGYPPEDLVLRPAFVAAAMRRAEELAKECEKLLPVIIGVPWKSDGLGDRPYNAAALLRGGKIEQLWFKSDLPNYGVFDDKRVFHVAAAGDGEPFLLNGMRIGVAICEDMWSKEKSSALRRRGADIIASIHGSPYETDKHAIRRAVITARIKENNLPVIYVNQLGGQDEIMFDGGSFVMDTQCDIRAFLGQHEEKIITTVFSKNGEHWVPEDGFHAPTLDEDANHYRVLCAGLKDYILKNKFPSVLIGMSGGIDSAFVAALAVDALGPEKVKLVMMPSPYTAKESLEDAQRAAQLLGTDYRAIPIKNAMQVLGDELKPHVRGFDTDIMNQNIQSRLRGLLLMALSNASGAMVLATGNKSEMATGYATLYGDMCGGFAPIKDAYKTVVYRLSRWRNVNKPEGALGPSGLVIPERIITRAPTAELKEEQTDQDTLPPYAQLDDILMCLIERELSVPEIISRGHEEAVVQKVMRMLKHSEYKRKQAPPGTKITARAFGRDRRYPITNAFFR